MCLPLPLRLEPGVNHPLEVQVSNKAVFEDESQVDLPNQQGVFLVEDMEDLLLIEEIEGEVDR